MYFSVRLLKFISGTTYIFTRINVLRNFNSAAPMKESLSHVTCPICVYSVALLYGESRVGEIFVNNFNIDF